MNEKSTIMPAALAAALVVAQATARAVGKDAKNQHHGYRYASAEGVIIEAREALTTADLALITVAWRFLSATTVDAETGEERPARGGPARVVVDYLIVHKSGETYPIQTSTPVVPDKGRPPDKAEFAALTANLAYTLRGVLLMPRDDEQASIDARDDRGYDPDRREAAREAPRQAAQREPSQPDPQPAPAGEPDERGAWEALAKDIRKRIKGYTERAKLKDEIVPEVIKLAKRGMPRDLVDGLREFYADHADELDGAKEAA